MLRERKTPLTGRWIGVAGDRRLKAPRMAACAVALFGLVGLAALPGCAGPSQQLSIEAPSPAPTALDVNNPFGGVTVLVDPRAESIDVRASIKDDDSSGEASHDEKHDAADLVRIDAETIETGQGRSVTRIDAAPISPGAATTRVELVVTTPRCDGVRARAAGDVILDGVSGGVDVETSQGSITVRIETPLRDPVLLLTTRGDITLTIPTASQGRLDVQAPTGSVNVRSSSTAIADAHAGRRRFTGVLNSGENTVLLRTGAGEATVQVGKRPSWLKRILP